MNMQTSDVLCSKCRRGAGCAVPGESGEFIVTCDSFEGIQPFLCRHGKELAGPSLRELGRIEGVCGDCENRGSCTFLQREGGVWHCEEYR